MKRKTRYTMYDKRGREMYHSDSFLGFIGTTIGAQLLGILLIIVVAAVICGIGSLFS